MVAELLLTGTKERRPTKITDRQNATMMLVGDVAERTAILIDDLADTSNTITRAARLLKKEGAKSVIALVTHGILSGDAIERINKSDLDKLVVTNSVPQEEHKKRCPKLEVLDVGPVFAEVWLVSFNALSTSIMLVDRLLAESTIGRSTQRFHRFKVSRYIPLPFFSLIAFH